MAGCGVQGVSKLVSGPRAAGLGAQSVSELRLVFWCWWVCQGLARAKVGEGGG